MDSVCIGLTSSTRVTFDENSTLFTTCFNQVAIWRSRSVLSGPGAKMDALALLSEHTQDFDRASRRAEPVRVLRVELRGLAGSHHDVMFAEHHPEPPGQHIDPFIATVGSQDRFALRRGDCDFECLRLAVMLRQRGEDSPVRAGGLLSYPRVLNSR